MSDLFAILAVLVVGFILGVITGAGCAVESIRAEAIRHDVAEYVVTNEYGSLDFRWKTNCFSAE